MWKIMSMAHIAKKTSINHDTIYGKYAKHTKDEMS